MSDEEMAILHGRDVAVALARLGTQPFGRRRSWDEAFMSAGQLEQMYGEDVGDSQERVRVVATEEEFLDALAATSGIPRVSNNQRGQDQGHGESNMVLPLVIDSLAQL